jgi:hypothetical protein
VLDAAEVRDAHRAWTSSTWSAQTHESLFSVWNSLASPAPYELAAVDGYARALLDDALALPGPTGLRSTLYRASSRGSVILALTVCQRTSSALCGSCWRESSRRSPSRMRP